MATIPIEVIVQDAEAPIVPSEDGTNNTETNIIVPDTGAGTVENGSNGGGIGSAVSIILPAIILVLAIGAMVALLIRRQQKRRDNNEVGISKKEKLATVASGTIAILAATVLVGNLVIPATNAATSVAPGTAELETEDKITITATRTANSDEVVATVKNTSYATANLDFGYKVTASMAEGLESANLYLDGDETSEYYFSPVEDGVLENNTWGYALEEPSEDTSYLSIPLEDTPTTIVKGTSEIEDEPVDIYYTIKADKDMPAGTYTGEIEYNISSVIEYMQDFAKLTEEEKTTTLANMPEGEQYILKDNRDEKPYYISKLADGNVWMTQNLDHDIVSTPNFYTYDNTDIGHGDTPDTSAIWTGTATYPTGTTTWNRSYTAPESYDSGDLYWNGIILGNETICEEYGGTWEPWQSCSGAIVTSSTGNSHYYIGNYYNWTAAVAMSDSGTHTTDGQDVNQSICPAGWRLPTFNGDKSYQNLVDILSLTSGTDGNIQDSPVYFAYGERRLTDSGSKAGINGYYWSSVVRNDMSSYMLGFNFGGSLNSQSNINRSGGLPLRCVVR